MSAAISVSPAGSDVSFIRTHYTQVTGSGFGVSQAIPVALVDPSGSARGLPLPVLFSDAGGNVNAIIWIPPLGQSGTYTLNVGGAVAVMTVT